MGSRQTRREIYNDQWQNSEDVGATRRAAFRTAFAAGSGRRRHDGQAAVSLVLDGTLEGSRTIRHGMQPAHDRGPNRILGRARAQSAAEMEKDRDPRSENQAGRLSA